MDARRRSARLNPPEPPDPSHVARTTTSSHESVKTVGEIGARPTGSRSLDFRAADIASLESGVASFSGDFKKNLRKNPNMEPPYHNPSQGTSEKLI